MSGKTGIQWCDVSWNPTVGCTRVSAGCDHCYAFDFHDRRMHVPYIKAKREGREVKVAPQFHQPFSKVQLMSDRIDDPKHWRKPRKVFVNSMSDLFHEDVPGSFINLVWNTMFNVRHHTYMILTKRPERLLEWTRTKAAYTHWPIEDIWPSWIWLGVSVEDQKAADERIPLLLQTPAAVRFLSCEPLLGEVDLSHYLQADEVNSGYGHYEQFGWGYDIGSGGFIGRGSIPYDPRPGLDWVIVGGESGKHARPMTFASLYLLINQCERAHVPVFVKQLGSVWARSNDGVRNRHGGDINEWPEDLRIREWPEQQR